MREKAKLKSNLNPLVKICLAVYSVILVFISSFSESSIIIKPLLIWLSIIIILWFLLGVEFWKLKRLWKTLVVIFTLIVVIQGFLYRGKTMTPIFVLCEFNVAGKNICMFTLEGLIFAIIDILKISCVVCCTILLVTTTDPYELASTMRKLKIPDNITMAFLIGMRFTSVVEETFNQILIAKKLRGYDIDRMNFFQKIKTYSQMVIPFILTLLEQGLTLQLVLETRAFGAPVKRTEIIEVKMKLEDWIIYCIVSIIFIFCLKIIFVSI